MSIFYKMLASVGIGAVQVDTHLEKSSFVPGEPIRGKIQIMGGNVEQEVDRIYVKLMTEYVRERDDRNHFKEICTIAKVNVSEKLTVKPGDRLDIPFEFPLPLETPLTMSRQPVWIHTGLDIDHALDPQDRDYIEVMPHPNTRIVLDAISELGFRFCEASCEFDPRSGRGMPFVQEFEFYPGSMFADTIGELELIQYLEEDRITVHIEIDRKGRGVSRLIELDWSDRESYMSLTESDLQKGTAYVAEKIRHLIMQLI